MAKRIAVRRFHLDHVGAEIGKDLSGVGTGQVLPEINDPDAGEEIRRRRFQDFQIAKNTRISLSDGRKPRPVRQDRTL